MADVRDVPTLRGGQRDRTSPQQQEAQVPDQVEEQQLVSQVQRDLQLVSAAVSVAVCWFMFTTGNTLTDQLVSDVAIVKRQNVC